MRKVVIDMQNYLFSDAIAKVLKSYDSDFFIEMSDTPDKTAELCRVIQPHILMMEITGQAADKEDDELIFANDEFLHMSGYKDIDELFRLTEKSFRNLIREDEQQQIESSIWEQIDSGNENDYIHFHLRKADGTYFSVLDHGRIVESPQYGKVFYVLFMDWEDMHIRYNDKFAR